MSNQTVLSSDEKSIKRSNSSVNNSLLKTHCIVCNTLFTKPRVGKLYCSNRCKQFGYNHKQLMPGKKEVEFEKKNQSKKKVFLEDYSYYLQMNNKLKRFKELSRRNEKFKEEERKMNNRIALGLPLNHDYYSTSNMILELNSDELDELENLEVQLSQFINLESHCLTIEQWSYFKLLYSKLDKDSFFLTICQFSKDYINQLNFHPLDPDLVDGNLSIKEKYILHCNEIAQGRIQFQSL